MGYDFIVVGRTHAPITSARPIRMGYERVWPFGSSKDPFNRHAFIMGNHSGIYVVNVSLKEIMTPAGWEDELEAMVEDTFGLKLDWPRRTAEERKKDAIRERLQADKRYKEAGRWLRNAANGY